MNDLVISSIAGLTLALLIIVLLRAFPGEPFEYKVGIDGDENELSEVSEEHKEKMKESIMKSKKLQGILGMSGDELKAALEKAKNDPPPSSSPFSVCRLIEYVVYILLFGLAFFCLNMFTNGDLGRMVVGMFPVEMEALGIKEELTSFSHEWRGEGMLSASVEGEPESVKDL